VPSLVVRVRPTRAGPEIEGNTVLAGGEDGAAYVAVKLAAVAGATMLCVAAPPSDHEENV
jgi:hypothetical protein